MGSADRILMIRLSPFFYVLLGILNFSLTGGAVNWDSKVSPGAECDPIALNFALGEKEVRNRDIVEKLRGAYGVGPYAFSNLVVRAPGVEVLKVSIRKDSGEQVPPDMAGTGPFFLLKEGTNYFALTQTNFARAFGPVTNQSEVLPYLKAHERLFGNLFAVIVTTTNRDLPRATNPPKRTKVVPVEDGFEVNLVLYTSVHVRAFYEVSLHLNRDGTVKRRSEPKMLLRLGDGIVF